MSTTPPPRPITEVWMEGFDQALADFIAQRPIVAASVEMGFRSSSEDEAGDAGA